MNDLKVGRIEQLTHTPGPWQWDGKFTVSIPHADGKIPFRVQPGDARLIAAAPEMYEALQMVLSLVRDQAMSGHFLSIEIREVLNTALAKAEGRS